MIRKNVSAIRDLRPLLIGSTALLFLAAGLFAVATRAQENAEILVPAMDPAELEELVGPVALYPDDVLGIILPASTFPLQIVQAARFLDDLETDSTLQPDEDWDDSVVALLNYPEVLRMMNEDLDWTWALGEAVLIDQSAVLAAAQDFRQRAYAAGNLATDERQVVTESEGTIAIKPADPEVVYIPYYDPREVVVYHPRPVYYYYPVAYPSYYYPYPVGYRFSTGFFFGVTSWFAVGWDSYYVHVHHHSHRLHPYYLNTHYYYRPYYYRSDVHVTVNVNNYVDVWQPSPRRAGARPQTVTSSGYTSTARTRQSATVETQPRVATRQTTTSRATGAANTKLAPAARDASRDENSAAEEQTSTSSPQRSESRRSTVGQGARASASIRSPASSRSSSSTPGSTPADILRRSDIADGAASSSGATGASRSSVRSSNISGVSESQIRSVPVRPGTTAAVTTPRPTPNERSSTRAATNATPATGTTTGAGNASVTARAPATTPRTTLTVPRATSVQTRSTTTAQSSVRTTSPAPRASVAVPRASTPTVRAPAPAASAPSSNGSSYSAPAAPAPRGTMGTSSSSRSTSSSSSSRRR